MAKYRMLALALAVASSFANADDVKVFKFSEDGAPTTFDTVQSGTTYSNTIVTAVYDTLYEYKYLKQPFELKPNLATSLPKVSQDGLIYTVSANNSAFFSDLI